MATNADTTVVLSDRQVDLVRQQVLFADGSSTSLTTRETQLLAYLAQRPQQDVSRDELLEQVWEYRATYATRAVDVAMRRLRAKIEPDPTQPVHLIAVHGVGYRFVPPTTSVAAPAEAPEPTEATNLRPDEGFFVGREREIAVLDELHEREARVVTVLGPGGIGKTRLATRWAAASPERWPGGAWLADLSGVGDRSAMLSTVAAALGVPLTQGSEAEQATALGASLSGRGPVLLVLDDVDRLVATLPELLGRWLADAPAARFLVTSRERLRLVGEHVVELGPLPSEAAGALFVERARAAGASVSSGPPVDRIVAQLDGLPLAIELAAPRARLMSLEQLHERLAQRAGLEEGGRPDALHGVIESSWELLDPHERVAFARCAVFVGGFPLDAAEAVLAQDDDDAPWPLDLLEALRDKSLLRVTEPPQLPGEVRFGLYESLRAFAEARLEELGQREEAEARHAAFFVPYGEGLREGVDRHGGLEAFERLALERENLLAVERRSREADPRTALHAVLGLQPVLLTRGPHLLYRELLDRAIAFSRLGAEAGCAESARIHGQLLVDSAALHRIRGRMDDARADLGRVLARLGEDGSLTEVDALLHLSLVNSDQSRLDEAEAIALQALDACRRHAERAGFRDREGILQGMLGSFSMMRGEVEPSERAYLAALEIHHEVGNERRAALDSANLGMLLADHGRIEEAEQRIGWALRVHRRWGNVRAVGTSLMSLSSLRARQDRIDEAVELVREALQRFREVGYARFASFAQVNLGSLLWAQGEGEKAVAHLLDGIEGHRLLGDRLSEGLGRAFLAALLATRGDVHGAEAALERCRVLHQGIYSRQAEATATMAGAFVELARARRDGREERIAATEERVRALLGEAHGSPLLTIHFLARLLERELDRG